MLSPHLSRFSILFLISLLYVPVQLVPQLENSDPVFSAQDLQDGGISTNGFFPSQVLVSYVQQKAVYNTKYQQNNPYDQRNYGNLETTTEFLCTGVIVNETTVLVPANCTFTSDGKQRPVGPYLIRVGIDSLSNDTITQANLYQVSQVIVNPQYQFSESFTNNVDNDLAFLLLRQPIQFNPYVYTPCFDFRDLLHPELYITGYGVVPILGDQIERLKYVYAHESIRSVCKNVTEICVFPSVDVPAGDDISCRSTLGGVIYTTRFDVVGFVSPDPNTNDPCSIRSRAIRLSPYQDWFERTLGVRSFCARNY